MGEHFITEKKTSNTDTVIFIMLLILTLGFGFFIFYDRFMEPKYFINRKRLINYLKTDKASVYLIDSGSLNSLSALVMRNIVDYKLYINGVEYQIWVWDNKKVTLSCVDLDKDMIGLFISSPISKTQNKKLIELINQKVVC